MAKKGDDNKKLPDTTPDNKPSNDGSSPKKKKSIWKRMWKAWCDWWKLTFESYVVEVEDRILMSWKRIIKFCGITIIPILYGVICSVAMWNPAEALGKAKTYIMDDDYSVLLVSDTPKTGNDYIFGATKFFNRDEDDYQAKTRKILVGDTDGYIKTGLKDDDIQFDPELGAIGIKNSAIKNDVERQKMSAIIMHNAIQENDGKDAVFNLADGNSTTYDPNDAGFQFQIASLWDVIKSGLNKKTDANKDDRDYTFSAPAFITHPKVALTNIHYSTDKAWNDKNYQKRKGWIQVKIPDWYTVRGINYISLMMKNFVETEGGTTTNTAVKFAQSQTQDDLAKIANSMEPLGLWTTYERNFLFGYMFDMMSGLLGSHIAMAMPGLANTAAISNVSQYMSTDAPTLASVTENLQGMDDSNVITVNDKDSIDMSKRYVVSDSTGLNHDGDNDARVNSTTLFGNVAQTTKENVGGKFINTLDMLSGFNDSALGKAIAKALGGDSLVNGLQGLVKQISDAIQQIIKSIKGDSETATYEDGKVQYIINNVSIDGVTEGDVSKYFSIYSDGKDPINDTLKGLAINLDNGKVTVTFEVPQTDADQKISYLIKASDSAKNNVNWGMPITVTVPKATSSKSSFEKLAAQSSIINENLDPQIEVYLNNAVYGIMNGKKINDLTSNEQTAIATLLKALGLSDAQIKEIESLNTINVFDSGKSPILEESEFDKRMDKFVAANSALFNGATTFNEVMPKLIAKKTSAALFGLNMDKVVTYKIQGDKFGYEGIGIGVFFLTVGLFVGCILHSFIFDRAKRLTKAKWSNWYFSKYMLLLTVAFFQVTAEVWVVYAAGWSAIGPTAMCYVWLWLLSADWMFTTIVQALWFSLKDEIIGKFLCVIVLVTSISAGGGEFPAWSEFGFYRAISYVVPFTYVINGFDEIVFGISLSGTHGWSTQFIFQQWGITLIYVAIFLAFGMIVGAQLRMKEMNYGSHYGFAVAGAMRALGRNTNEFQVLRRVTKKGKKRYYYNWKSLTDGFDPELYFQCRRMYKFAGEFKWWKRKHHDFVQKPNYSDEEIVSRNE